MLRYTEYNNFLKFFEKEGIEGQELKKRFIDSHGNLYYYGWYYLYKDIETDDYVFGVHRFKKKFEGEGHIEGLTKEGNFDETVISFLDSECMNKIPDIFRCIEDTEAKRLCKEKKLKRISSKYYTLFYDKI